tara:strand:- start:5431 stop:6678 length:1248 start_codon:yes stop_codon:yes gene_type:complete
VIVEVPPDLSRIRRTFFAESVRAVSAGVIETALATFAILIAVKVFDAGPVFKSIIIAAPAIGLLGSFGAVSLVGNSRLKASHAAGLISLGSTFGFVLAAAGAHNETCFLVGITIGVGLISMGMPLQIQYLRHNYPSAKRGRLFSVSVFIRAFTGMAVSWGFGEYLDQDLSNYPVLLWVFAGAAAVSGLCQFTIPSEPLRATVRTRSGFFDSLHIAREDRVFVKLLVSSMVLGIGILSAMALRVDYLVNPVHGLELDIKTVSLITGVIPGITRLISTFFWGWLFDHVSFFKVRIAINLLFLVGLLLYFIWPDTRLILIGSALFGLARGGGEIFFNLFVTKLATPEHVADYMSVHTFLAGVRTLLAPFIGFFLVQWANIPVMVVLSMALVLIALFFVGTAAKQSREDELGKGTSGEG